MEGGTGAGPAPISNLPPAAPAPSADPAAAARFRRTLVRVMAVQVAALALLWLLQSRYTP